MAGRIQKTPKSRSTTTTKLTRKVASDGKRSPTHDEIAVRAHQLHEQSVCQSGRDVDFWLEAERQLREELKV